ncbi:hypothetical protein [Pseudonocardia petroleophila]|uniref:hypothetical protein n=1 Tax=Pseudonocardia petroleophila TaxID=37331 RepID=UPI0031DF22EC
MRGAGAVGVSSTAVTCSTTCSARAVPSSEAMPFLSRVRIAAWPARRPPSQVNPTACSPRAAASTAAGSTSPRSTSSHCRAPTAIAAA